ncbi:hypothetical protein LCGC14_1524810 [marine sediment metagenome]|uniref:Uncharacterized protein n=1 Tax=marine sediment metagenome TaxID=412755 RepID=A0A0F9IXH7_9ZZZZ
MRSLEMSIVFKVTSVEDLGLLYAALKQVKTLQEMVKLENDIRQLKGQKNILQNELKEIKSEIHTLCPEKLLKKESDEMDKEPESEEEETEATVELERPEAVRVEHVEEAAPLIEERTDGEPQEEEESIV